MIVLETAATNLIYLTCTEKSELASPIYLIRFINDTGKNETSCIVADTSSYTYRYNKFSIVEKAISPDRTAGEVTLSPYGYWRYEVYEQTSTTNLDYTLASKLVELGKCHVIGESTSWSAYNSQPTTFKVYE